MSVWQFICNTQDEIKHVRPLRGLSWLVSTKPFSEARASLAQYWFILCENNKNSPEDRPGSLSPYKLDKSIHGRVRKCSSIEEVLITITLLYYCHVSWFQISVVINIHYKRNAENPSSVCFIFPVYKVSGSHSLMEMNTKTPTSISVFSKHTWSLKLKYNNSQAENWTFFFQKEEYTNTADTLPIICVFSATVFFPRLYPEQFDAVLASGNCWVRQSSSQLQMLAPLMLCIYRVMMHNNNNDILNDDSLLCIKCLKLTKQPLCLLKICWNQFIMICKVTQVICDDQKLMQINTHHFHIPTAFGVSCTNEIQMKSLWSKTLIVHSHQRIV